MPSQSMPQPIPRSPAEWLNEIKQAFEAPSETDSPADEEDDLSRRAAFACLRLRGRELTGPEARRVFEVAHANYEANAEAEAGEEDEASLKPLLSFAVCYVSAHFVLELIDVREAETILNYCEKNL